VASEPVSFRESVVARYRRWNRDRAIEWAMGGSPPLSPKKKVGDGAGSSNTKDGAAVFQWLVREVGSGVATPYSPKRTTPTGRG
jgi:hypothetical protein